MRTITGAVFVAIMIGGIIWNFWSYVFLFSLISLLGIWEFFSLMEERINILQKVTGTIFGAILLAASCGKYFYPVSHVLFTNGLFIIILIFPLFLFAQLFRQNNTLTLFSPILFGILYVNLPFCYLLLAYSSGSYWSAENNSKIILGYFFLIWSNDTFAYLVGRSFGKTKLFERISPKKTWEGTIGGVICTIGIGYVLSIYFTALSPLYWMILALIVSITGTLGDLVESMFKRSLGVKDSGNILPGHGGILDRFDGVLLSAPFVVAYLIIVAKTS
jgi:phosphatidate cytidylyltransferase